MKESNESRGMITIKLTKEQYEYVAEWISMELIDADEVKDDHDDPNVWAGPERYVFISQLAATFGIRAED